MKRQKSNLRRKEKRSVPRHRSKSLRKDRKDPLEELFSRRIGELVNFRIFGKYWKSLVSHKRGMLVKESVRKKLDKRRAMLAKRLAALNRRHHKNLSVDGSQ